MDPLGLKLLTRLRVNLSHLREHKFHHNFLDTLNPLCSCSLEIESTSHYLLRCRFYTYIRRALLDNITNLIGDISNFSDDKLMNLLLYGDNIHSVEVNSGILKYTLIFYNHPKGLMVHYYYKLFYSMSSSRTFYLLYYFIFNLCAVPHW